MMPHNLTPEKIYKELIKIANDDGIISSDEQNLIDAIKTNLEKYYHILDESYKDNMITDEEQFNMYQSRQQVLDEALKVAKANDEVSQDQMKLLFALKRLLEELGDDEHY